MKALQFPGSCEVIIREMEKPKPGKKDVIVRMKAAGICGSDLNYLYRVPKEEKDKPVYGYQVSPTVIPGHEPCGIIDNVGGYVTKFKKGDRVIVYHVSGCGSCIQCRAGFSSHCNYEKTYGFNINGAFADYMLADEKDLVLLPGDMPFEAGCYYACGAGTSYKAIKRLKVSGFDVLVVFGLGPVGLASVILGKQAGAKIIGIDPVKMRRKLAKKIGADLTIDSKGDVVKEIMKYTKGKGASRGIETSSNPIARSQILDSAALWGRVAYVGEGKTVTIDVSSQIIKKQLSIIGSQIFSIPDLMELLEYASDEKIYLSDIITHRFNISEAREALSIADSGECGKVIFIW